MFAEFTGSLKQSKTQTKNSDFGLLLVAGAFSIILHGLIAHNWQPPAPEPLPVKVPQVVEVTMVTLPPPKPLPVVKPEEPPKPKVTKPKLPDKPKQPKSQPKVKPPTPKAPPKVMQKTIVEAAPEVKESKPTYSPVPVFAPPSAPTKPKPGPTVATSSTAKPTASHQGNTGSSGSSGVVVLKRVKPKYPARALSRHLEGHVTIQFTVNGVGQVENASVTSATPSGVFEEAALAAIKQWEFKQKTVNGAAVNQRAVQTLNFKLDN